MFSAVFLCGLDTEEAAGRPRTSRPHTEREREREAERKTTDRSAMNRLLLERLRRAAAAKDAAAAAGADKEDLVTERAEEEPPLQEDVEDDDTYSYYGFYDYPGYDETSTEQPEENAENPLDTAVKKVNAANTAVKKVAEKMKGTYYITSRGHKLIDYGFSHFSFMSYIYSV